MTREIKNISDFACKPMEKVRIGFVGLGRRGMANLRRYFIVPHVEIVALCDIDRVAVERVSEETRQSLGYMPRRYYDWSSLCRVAGTILDLVIVSTDWASHAAIACSAMEAGVHVAVEVPLAPTIEECGKIVATAGHTRRHCIMLENCCYDPFALHTLELVKSGAIGEVTHCEGAYIHCLAERYSGNQWVEKEWLSHCGNPYPTHAIGPVCQVMDINRSDRLVNLVSLTGRGPDGEARVNTTLISTGRGRSIMLQHDILTPRPYSRMQTVCATSGYVSKYPMPIVSVPGTAQLTGDDAERYLSRYQSAIERAYADDAARLGVDNLMNYYMDRRLIDLLREGAPMDINVYDAALWSSIAELTAISVERGGAPVAIPSFI